MAILNGSISCVKRSVSETHLGGLHRHTREDLVNLILGYISILGRLLHVNKPFYNAGKHNFKNKLPFTLKNADRFVKLCNDTYLSGLDELLGTSRDDFNPRRNRRLPGIVRPL
jgi:hypothetical protein